MQCSICFCTDVEIPVLCCKAICLQCVTCHGQARWEMGFCDVSCPTCSNPVPEEKLMPVLPDELFQKLRTKRAERAAAISQGQAMAEDLLAQAESESGLSSWMLETGAQQCPQCRAVLTKKTLSDQATQKKECHKMLCRLCGCKFCFKCLAVLTPSFNCGCSHN